MRYLYGDSAPFPLQYNFLQTLEAFVAAAARAAQLDAEARHGQEAIAEATVTRGRAVAALEGFHQTIIHALEQSGAKSSEPQVQDYIRALTETASRIVDSAKSSAVAAAEREQATARVEVDRRKNDIRAALQQFLTVGRLPVLESRVGMGLIDGRNELSAVFTHPEGIVTSFTLSAGRVPAWQQPRRVADFAQGVDLMIGVKKSMFSRSAHPENVRLDEYVLSGFDLSDDSAEIRLRRKVTDPREAFIFTLRRTEAELHVSVQRPSEVEAEAPLNVDHQDRQQLERLWQLIRAGVSDALVHKERLVTVTLDGDDLFDQGKAIPFIERVVKILAPTVAEIAKRSPSPHELSLKMEQDGGRREEIYLKKEELASKLEPLSGRERQIFSPLSLAREMWLSDANILVSS
jgi:hypothetical protein